MACFGSSEVRVEESAGICVGWPRGGINDVGVEDL